jgi:hypothetical protein
MTICTYKIDLMRTLNSVVQQTSCSMYGATTLNITAQSITTLSLMTHSITTLIIMTFSITVNKT